METSEKSSLRRQVLALRANISQKERKKAEILLTERIIGHQWFYRSDILLGFVSYGTEISTLEILKEALRQKKKVYVPKVSEKNQALDASGELEMIFYRIFSMDELVPGYKGIPEPKGDSEAYVYQMEKDIRTLLLMPGAAFDPFGNRIGYGGGFYDRFLADKEDLRLCSIAVGFKCQMVEQIPVEEHDVKPYQIICV
ncbi:MAG: 5-formyltetrahydrofolate cyclo-ligase [Bacteroidales bacterium]|nr:5-formyltetrahydrofolate cyclo-ligase [Lachnoclostridium sp.]MCM1383058.1 5-formyltetrahydrofolate cyclo-ligase [Lachnoclostridium sp.]MCM1463887.1 5-formyltetrahydrofolate cyclo-ligase [Bacteroidales bacterium]